MCKRLDKIRNRYGSYHASILTHQEMIRNIIDVYHSASDAEKRWNWYKEANAFAAYLAEAYDFSVPAASGIISALSPQNKWERNMRDAEAVCGSIAMGLKVAYVSVATYNANKFKAADIAYEFRNGTADEIAPIFKGPKTEAFFRNIADPEDPYTVTVDFHAYSIAVGFRYTSKSLPSMGKGDYNKVANAYRSAAAILGVKPNQVQAVTWVAWRNRNVGQLDLFS